MDQKQIFHNTSQKTFQYVDTFYLKNELYLQKIFNNQNAQSRKLKVPNSASSQVYLQRFNSNKTLNNPEQHQIHIIKPERRISYKEMVENCQKTVNYQPRAHLTCYQKLQKTEKKQAPFFLVKSRNIKSGLVNKEQKTEIVSQKTYFKIAQSNDSQSHLNRERQKTANLKRYLNNKNPLRNIQIRTFLELKNVNNNPLQTFKYNIAKSFKENLRKEHIQYVNSHIQYETGQLKSQKIRNQNPDKWKNAFKLLKQVMKLCITLNLTPTQLLDEQVFSLYAFDKKGNLNMLDSNQFFTSCLNEEFYYIRYHLSENPYYVYAIDENGNTAMHIAIIKNNFEMVKLLHKFKSDLNAENNVGVSCLQMALQNKNAEIIIFLLEHKVWVANYQKKFKIIESEPWLQQLFQRFKIIYFKMLFMRHSRSKEFWQEQMEIFQDEKQLFFLKKAWTFYQPDYENEDNS